MTSTVRCPVCDKEFKTKMVKAGKVKRLEPDADLRPRQQYVDSLKYDVASCPNCGYTSLNRYFEHITMGQIKLIKEQISRNFHPQAPSLTMQHGIMIRQLKCISYPCLIRW